MRRLMAAGIVALILLTTLTGPVLADRAKAVGFWHRLTHFYGINSWHRRVPHKAFMVIPASTRDAFPTVQLPDAFGFNLQRNAGTLQDVAWVRQAGAKVVRLPMMWWDVEKIRGSLDFALYDPIMAEFKRQGIRPVVCLAFGNTLYVDNWAVRTPEALAAFTRFAAAAASRYKDQDVIWEIWNEPNLASFWKPQSDFREYMALVRTVSPAIRAADPTALIIGPSLANTVTPFMLNCLKSGLLNLVDGVAVHPYQKLTYPEAMEKDLNMLKGWLRQYAPGRTVPIVFTEWGYSSANTSEADRANFLMRESMIGMLHNIPVNIWFNFRNKPGICRTDGTCYGILSNDYKPFPAYSQFQAFASQLAGYRFIQRLQTPYSHIYCLLFSNGQNSKVVAWTTGVSTDPTQPAASNPTVTLSNGVTLNLSKTPIIRDVTL